ncbi:MAG: methionyl-tRNA formyltransferase [Undibacterium sp.]
MPSEPTPESEKTAFSAPQVSIVFMGTPALAETALEALIREKYHIVGVVTQPDRKSGRKQELTPSPVKVLAEKHGLPLLQPEKLDTEAVKTIRNWKPDVIVVAAYGRILPESLLEFPGFGCLNIHTSLLPRWRGASPVANALIAGDAETGVTLMELDRGMDTGAIIATEKTPIGSDERADELLTRLSQMGAKLLTNTLPLWIKRQITSTPQPEEGVTLCQLIEREDGHLFWTEEAITLYNRYRGLHPWPGVFTYWRRGADDVVRIKLHELSLQKTPPAIDYPIGSVVEIGEKIGIVTGSGVLFPLTIQIEGKEAVSIADFLKGYPSFVGSVLM